MRQRFGTAAFLSTCHRSQYTAGACGDGSGKAGCEHDWRRPVALEVAPSSRQRRPNNATVQSPWLVQVIEDTEQVPLTDQTLRVSLESNEIVPGGHLIAWPIGTSRTWSGAPVSLKN